MKFNLVGAAAIAATACFTDALPRADVEELGYCAQFLPERQLSKRGIGQTLHRWRLLSRRSNAEG
jgi:hypothetical protein